MDLLGFTPEQYSAAAAWASVLVLAVTGKFIYGQVAEAQRLRLEQSRPFVVVRWHMEGHLIQLCVENIGRTVAHAIRLSFDQPLRSASFTGKDFMSLNLMRDGIPMLAPGQSIKVHFDTGPSRAESALPMTYTAAVTYEDSSNRAYGPEHFVLDLNVYMDTAIGPRGVPDLVKEVEKIRKELHKWTDGTNGLRVYGIDRAKYRSRADRPWRIRQALAVRKQEGVVAMVRHFVSEWRLKHGFFKQ